MSGQRIVKVFIASPNDLAQERQVFIDTVAQFNSGFAEGAGTQIEALRWEGLPALYGPRPQDVINELIDKCDVFVLALHRRWGQEAKGTGFSSYTEEEYRRAEALFQRNGKPRILVFLKRIAPEFLDDPGSQLAKVLEFRKELQESGKVLYREFETPKDFEKEIGDHLKKYIRGELIDPSQTTLLPPQVIEALKQGISAMKQAKSELENALKTVENLQRLQAEFSATLAQVLGETFGKELSVPSEADFDVLGQMRKQMDDQLELAKLAIASAVHLATNPDVKAFLKSLEAVILLLPPRPPGFDSITLRAMQRMLRDFNNVCESAKKGSVHDEVMSASRMMFEAAIGYEKSKAQTADKTNLPRAESVAETTPSNISEGAKR